MASSNQKNIAVIGAGYTGLVAAYQLAKAGHKVTIFERGETLGGLAGDFTIAGEPIEKAYHHLFKTDTDIIAMAKELGIADKLQWHDSSVAIYYDGHLYPFVTPVDLAKFKPLSFINRVRAGLVVLYLQKTKNWQQFTNISAYEWMLKYSGPQVTKVIWEPLLKGKFDHFYDKVSMAWLWARLHIRANSKEPGDTGEKLGYFDGGFAVFTEALVVKLNELGVEIKTGAILTKVGSGKKPFVEMNGEKLEFDRIIATTPSTIFARLAEGDEHLTPEYAAKLDSIDYIGAALMVFSSTQDISKYYWHNINDTDLPFLVFINHTKLVSPQKYQGKYVYYIGAYLPHDHRYFTVSDDELRAEWFKGLKKVFPDFDESKIDELHTFRFKNAQHIVDTDYQAKIPEYATPLPGVFLANFSQIYPEDRGTNYAVREGKKVADLAAD